ncbi:hypothetical protein ALC57_13058 [Trachymyrmex cornetzi]|uniref:Uncharacterized protein n=1 Tax=Trachymyrmex cornetzi TaxID=471704 RepID=A0A151J042_9HYME|nr:hypothetical protein ALC57_13058 [Trachymyrmex cornetzi]
MKNISYEQDDDNFGYHVDVGMFSFLYMRCFKPKTLFFVNNETFDYFYKHTIMKYFIKYRIKIDCPKERLRRKIFSSKTIAMHSIVK